MAQSCVEQAAANSSPSSHSSFTGGRLAAKHGQETDTVLKVCIAADSDQSLLNLSYQLHLQRFGLCCGTIFRCVHSISFKMQRKKYV